LLFTSGIGRAQIASLLEDHIMGINICRYLALNLGVSLSKDFQSHLYKHQALHSYVLNYHASISRTEKLQ